MPTDSSWYRGVRNRHLFILDALLLTACPFLVFTLRFEGFRWAPGFAWTATVYAAVLVPVRLAILYFFGVYKCMWRHASLGELERIIRAGAVSALASFVLGSFIVTQIGPPELQYPLAILTLDSLLVLVIVATPRLYVRMAGRNQLQSDGARRVLIAGAGATGRMILKEIQASHILGLDVVGFIDDDQEKAGQLLGGISVLGTIRDIPHLVRERGVDEVIMAMPSARGTVVREILQAALKAGIATRTVPSFHDLLAGRVQVTHLRNVQIEDLLRREPVKTDVESVRSLAAGQTVLVTGAGGSIGSELCRQLADLSPRRLILLGHGENSIFDILGELHDRAPKILVVPVIADVRDARRMITVFDRWRPNAVFHAAAHKHVPLMEENVVEAVTNNVLGTKNVLQAARRVGAKHFVLVSTDKAVRPTSIMGATKRVGEMLVQHAAAAEGHNFVSVRFGNVLGSRGSVIPTFLQQIRQGGPVTVTHAEMRRFFMTIPEAVQLVLQAGALGAGGELFVLDMGEPVKIMDLAADLIRLSGLEVGTDIEIQVTGIRPGEKLYEEVFFGGEDVQPTAHPKVLRATTQRLDPKTVERIESLLSVVENPVEDSRIRELVREIVPDYASPAEVRERGRPSPTAPSASTISIAG